MGTRHAAVEAVKEVARLEGNVRTLTPTKAGDLIMASARMEAEAALDTMSGRGHLMASDRKRAGALAERVRGLPRHTRAR